MEMLNANEHVKTYGKNVIWKGIGLHNKTFNKIKINEENKNKTFREIYLSQIKGNKSNYIVSSKGVNIKDLDLSIEFKRTIRVPDDGNEYPLPPSLGDLPLEYNNGKINLVMYPFEALWFNFRYYRGHRLALKIGIGNINAISGLPWQDGHLSDEPQNYVILPKQYWLDGIKCLEPGEDTPNGFAENLVRQFVASEYNGITIEEQMKEKGTIDSIDGRLKFEVFEEIDNNYCVYNSKTDEFVTLDSTPFDMGLDEDDHIVYIAKCDNTLIKDVTLDDINFKKGDMKIEKLITVFAKTLTGKNIMIKCFPSIKITDFKSEIRKKDGIPENQQRLIFGGVHLTDDKSLDDYGIKDCAVLHLVLRLRGGGDPRQLGLAVGGKIKQCIFKNMSNIKFERNPYCSFNVQIVNACYSKTVYKTPMSAMMYNRYGYPWFKRYDTNLLGIALDVRSGFKEIKSIRDAPVELEECYICMENYSNLKLKCSHTICTDCSLKIEKTDSCPFCRGSLNLHEAKILCGIIELKD